MPVAAAKPTGRRRRIRIRRLQVFESGKHRGRRYSDADLDAMIRNFKRNQKKMPVPLVVGHKEEDFDDTAILAHGWMTNLYRKGKKLYGDFDNVSPQAAEWIRDHRLRNISPEIYDKPPDGTDGEGRMTRRVSMLGGEQPQVKGMEGLQNALVEQYGEMLAKHWPTCFRVREVKQNKAAGTWTCFAEIRPMQSEEFIKDMATRGIDLPLLEELQAACKAAGKEGLSDAILAEWTRSLDRDQEDMPEVDEDTAPEEDEKLPEGDDDMPATATQERAEEEVPNEELAEDETEDMAEPMAPEDDKDMKAMAEYGSACKKYSAWKSKKMAENGQVTTETGGVDETPTTDKPEPAMPMPKKVVTHYAEKTPVTYGMLRRVIPELITKAIGNQLAEAKKFSEQYKSDTKKDNVEAFLQLHSFCEGDPKGKQVRILPIELDPTDPLNLRNQLMAADASTVVMKFSEGKREVKMTAFDVLRKNIERRKPVNFSERIQTHNGGAVNGNGKAKVVPAKKGAAAEEEDDECGKVRQIVETFSEHFPKGADSLVEGFKIARKANPRETAESFTGIDL